MSAGRTAYEEAQLPRETYYSDPYFSEQQLLGFTEQIRLVRSCEPSTVLEVGKGNGFVSTFLKASGVAVTTIDVNESLEPDVVGSVLELTDHFSPESFELVLCAEVLEHLPFEHFEAAVSEIATVTSGSVVLTLPRAQTVLLDLRVSMSLWRLMRRRDGALFVSLPRSKTAAQHHWELDSSRPTRSASVRRILESKFDIISWRRMIWNPYHRSIVLRRQG